MAVGAVSAGELAVVFYRRSGDHVQRCGCWVVGLIGSGSMRDAWRGWDVWWHGDLRREKGCTLGEVIRGLVEDTRSFGLRLEMPLNCMSRTRNVADSLKGNISQRWCSGPGSFRRMLSPSPVRGALRPSVRFAPRQPAKRPTKHANSPLGAQQPTTRALTSHGTAVHSPTKHASKTRLSHIYFARVWGALSRGAWYCGLVFLGWGEVG
jgi:hypothetical protein